MDDIINTPLNRIELTPVGALVSLGQFENWGAEYFIFMRSTDHK